MNSARLTTPGPFVVASTDTNDLGFQIFDFGLVPYVHHSPQGADQEARRLARKYGHDFTIFGKLVTVGVEVTVERTQAVDAEELATNLARLVKESFGHITVDGARKIVKQALHELAPAPEVEQ